MDGPGREVGVVGRSVLLGFLVSGRVVGWLLVNDAPVLQVLERLHDGEVFLVLVIQDETLLQSHAAAVLLALLKGGFPDCGVVDEAALAPLATRASG